MADECKLVDYVLDILIDKGARKQQEVEQEQKKHKDNTKDKDERP